MADNTFSFDIDANISSATRNIDTLKQGLDSLQKIGQKAPMNADYLSLGQINKALDKVKELNGAYNELNQTMDVLRRRSGSTTPAQSEDLAFLQQQYQSFNKGGSFYNTLQSSQGNIFKNNFSNNAGLNAYAKHYNAMTDENVDKDHPLDSVGGTLQSLDDWKQDAHLMSRRQSLRYGQAMANGRMSEATFNAYNRDNSEAINRFSGYGNQLQDAIGKARGRIEQTEIERAHTAGDDTLSDVDRARTLAVQNDVIKQNEQLVDKLKKFNDELNNTNNTLKENQSNLQGNSNLTITPSGGLKGYFNRRASSIVYRASGRMIGSLQGQEAAGKALNSQTDDQSINLAYATGSANDQAIRDQLFNVNQKNSNGYGLSDSLNLYQYALMRQGYAGGGVGQTTSMVNQMELGGNDTGIGRSEYQQYAGTVAAGGGLNNTGDVNRINNAVTGMNVYGGTMGLQQQQAQTLTQLVQQIGQQRVVSSQDTANIAGVEGILAKDGGRQLQGQQGQQAMGQLNGSFINASEGNNQRMVQMLMMSNPTKYQGGLAGYNKAEGELSKGLASNDNINLAAELSNMYGGANGGAVVLQSQFGVKSHQAAQKLSEIFQNGDLSEEQRDKAVAKIEKEGSSKRAGNQSTYNGSTTATRNSSTARLERIDSQTDSAYQQTIGKILNAMQGLPTFMVSVGSGVRSIVEYLAMQAIASGGGNLIKDLTERKNSSGLGEEESEAGGGGGGFFGGDGLGGKIKGRLNKYADNHERVGRLRDRYRNVRGKVRDRVGGLRDKVSGWTGGHLFSKGGSGETVHTTNATESVAEDAAKGAGSHLGALSRVGRVIGRGNDIAMVGMGALSLYNDVKSKHPIANTVKDGSSMAGAAAGGWAGAQAGAGIGAGIGGVVGSVLPFAGTAAGIGVGGAIGGVVGGIGGSIAGSSLGSWVGGKAVDGWNWLTKEHHATRGSHWSRSAGHGSSSADYATGNTEYQNINKTDDNNRHKKENLNTEEQQLTKAQSLLNQSRSQNGIIGKTDGDNTTAIAGMSSGKVSSKKTPKTRLDENASGNDLLNQYRNGGTLGTTKHSKKANSDSSLHNVHNPNLAYSPGSKAGNNTFNVSLNMHGSGNSDKDGKRAAKSFMSAIKEKMQNGIDNNASNYTVVNSGNDMPWA